MAENQYNPISLAYPLTDPEKNSPFLFRVFGDQHLESIWRYYLRQEPGAVVPHAGICAGGIRQLVFLPRQYTYLGQFRINWGRLTSKRGVITGDRSINWINSLIIPGKDDGKVSIESAKIEGMADFLVAYVSHPFIMKDKMVMTERLHFFRNGFFTKKSEKGFDLSRTS